MTTSAAKSVANSGSGGNSNHNNNTTATTRTSSSSSSSSTTAATTNCSAVGVGVAGGVGIADGIIGGSNGATLVTGVRGGGGGGGAAATMAATTVGGALAAAGTTRAMQSDEDFNIRFVNLVRTHKCLYDKKVPEYRNRDNQEKAWALISHETRESVVHCKERWRNLRACLSRYIKQQSSSDPQHKPYYLTEHMAFLLPFLKSTRNSIENGIGHHYHLIGTNHTNSNNNNNNSLATLFQIAQQEPGQALGLHAVSAHLLPGQAAHLQFGDQLELKHSLSDNEDEETIDAFDPAITASMQQHRQQQHQQHLQQHQQQQHFHGARSPTALSDTASANTMQNFIPDVQLAELPEGTAGQASDYAAAAAQHGAHHHQHHPHHQHAQSNHQHYGGRSCDYDGHEPKRIKSETLSLCPDAQAQLAMYSAEHSDMEFFRSILPDLAALTPQQKRKFKIGILELIDDVVERFPVGATATAASAAVGSSAPTTTSTTAPTSSSSGSGGVGVGGVHAVGKQRRSSAREWRK